MELFRGAHRVSSVPYKGRRKPKNCISGRGRGFWSIKASQSSFMEDQSCARSQSLRLCGGSCPNESPAPSWLGKPPLQAHLTAAPSPPGAQLGPWHLLSLDPATSTPRLCPRSWLSLVWQHVPTGDNEWLENK